MGFNKRKLEDQRRQAADKEAANRRVTDAQVLKDAERLIAVWNERQAKRMPMIFSPTIGAAIARAFGFCGFPVRLAEPSTQSTYARWIGTSTPRGVKPHSGALLPLVSAECSVRGACAAIKDQHYRRSARDYRRRALGK